MTTNFKLANERAREVLAATIANAPWHARPELQRLLERDKPIEITVGSAKRKHTDAQRGYYWLCVGIFAKHYHCTKPQMHEIVLCECFGAETIMVNDKPYPIANERSRDQPVEMYSLLIETLLGLAALAGCALPDPNDAD